MRKLSLTITRFLTNSSTRNDSMVTVVLKPDVQGTVQPIIPIIMGIATTCLLNVFIITKRKLI